MRRWFASRLQWEKLLKPVCSLSGLFPIQLFTFSSKLPLKLKAFHKRASHGPTKGNSNQWVRPYSLIRIYALGKSIEVMRGSSGFSNPEGGVSNSAVSVVFPAPRASLTLPWWCRVLRLHPPTSCLCLISPPFCEHPWAMYPLMLSACGRLLQIVPCTFANLQDLFFTYLFFLLLSLKSAFPNVCLGSWFQPSSLPVTIGWCIFFFFAGEHWPLNCVGCYSLLLCRKPSRKWPEFWTVKCTVKGKAAEAHFHHLFGDFPEFLCCLSISDPYFQSGRCCLNDSLLLDFFF